MNTNALIFVKCLVQDLAQSKCSNCAHCHCETSNNLSYLVVKHKILRLSRESTIDAVKFDSSPTANASLDINSLA